MHHHSTQSFLFWRGQGPVPPYSIQGELCVFFTSEGASSGHRHLSGRSFDFFWISLQPAEQWQRVVKQRCQPAQAEDLRQPSPTPPPPLSTSCPTCAYDRPPAEDPRPGEGPEGTSRPRPVSPSPSLEQEPGWGWDDWLIGDLAHVSAPTPRADPPPSQGRRSPSIASSVPSRVEGPVTAQGQAPNRTPWWVEEQLQPLPSRAVPTALEPPRVDAPPSPADRCRSRSITISPHPIRHPGGFPEGLRPPPRPQWPPIVDVPAVARPRPTVPGSLGPQGGQGIQIPAGFRPVPVRIDGGWAVQLQPELLIDDESLVPPPARGQYVSPPRSPASEEGGSPSPSPPYYVPSVSPERSPTLVPAGHAPPAFVDPRAARVRALEGKRLREIRADKWYAQRAFKAALEEQRKNLHEEEVRKGTERAPPVGSLPIPERPTGANGASSSAVDLSRPVVPVFRPPPSRVAAEGALARAFQGRGPPPTARPIAVRGPFAGRAMGPPRGRARPAAPLPRGCPKSLPPGELGGATPHTAGGGGRTPTGRPGVAPALLGLPALVTVSPALNPRPSPEWQSASLARNPVPYPTRPVHQPSHLRQLGSQPADLCTSPFWGGVPCRTPE